MSLESDVQICNAALSQLRGKAISSLTENTSEEGRVCGRLYATCRRRLLIEYSWTFARKRSALTRVDEALIEGYSYVYIYPAGALHIHREENDNADYRLEGDRIYANTDTLTLQYVVDVTDPTKFSAAFVSAFIEYLQWKLCMPLTGDKVLAREYKEDFLLSVNSYAALGIQQGGSIQPTSSSFEDSRSGE